MSLAMPAALMLMALSAAPTEASGVLPPCAEGERRVEWQEDTPGRVQEVCISPGWATTFFFDARVERLELEGPERFQVLRGEEGFSLRLKEKLPEGTRLALTVHLQGEAVASLSFALRVHAERGERQVVVSRAARTLASYREGEKQARAELRQCQQQKERLLAELAASRRFTYTSVKRVPVIPAASKASLMGSETMSTTFHPQGRKRWASPTLVGSIFMPAKLRCSPTRSGAPCAGSQNFTSSHRASSMHRRMRKALRRK